MKEKEAENLQENAEMKDKKEDKMNDEIKYNVKTIVNTDSLTEKEVVKLFNEKLLKIILSSEKSSICQG